MKYNLNYDIKWKKTSIKSIRYNHGKLLWNKKLMNILSYDTYEFQLISFDKLSDLTCCYEF